MQVAVQVHGCVPSGAARFGLELPDRATAGELLERLEQRGVPLRCAATSLEARMPRQLRMFVDGALIARRDQRLAAGASSVTVVLLTPISGG
jgi:hypothetical protein